MSPYNITPPFMERSCQPYTILYMAATRATNSVWHVVHRWGSIHPGLYYQGKEFPFLGTGKSTSYNTMPFSTVILS